MLGAGTRVETLGFRTYAGPKRPKDPNRAASAMQEEALVVAHIAQFGMYACHKDTSLGKMAQKNKNYGDNTTVLWRVNL